MSYDVTVYFFRAIAPKLPWNAFKGFSIDGPLKVDPSDVPKNHRTVVGARSYIWQIHFQNADQFAARVDWLHGILAKHNALAIDDQTESYMATAQSGLLPPDSDARPNPANQMGALTVYFDRVADVYPAKLADIVRALEKFRPSAMPIRYGGYEPLQSLWEGGDASELVREWTEDADLFLKARTPLSHIFCSFPCPAGLRGYHPDHGIRSKTIMGRISIDLRPKVFSDARIMSGTVQLLEELAQITGAFYGEIRRKDCPVRSWFWRGIPPGPVEAMVIGSPYLELWPEASAQGTSVSDAQILIKTPKIAPPPEISCVPPSPALTSNDRGAFAEVFPFPIGQKIEALDR